ncbi:hypothetical protein I553_9047 [Mycobacterium xenopi 4042]|uniref:Uncharacterized protein n=1 Tax=Mycobacterium xenopi 4042 TaxID=1299334 RepID=X8AMZ5_MYCXE|nr:hypothetical protein I553_9047 [Mycobacterium xenopi 4042]
MFIRQRLADACSTSADLGFATPAAVDDYEIEIRSLTNRSGRHPMLGFPSVSG